MKILVSAPACNPYQGSEGGVGWSAVCRIARVHDVYVLTDANQRKDWDKARNEGLVPANVRSRFLRKSTKYVENRFLARIQSWLWYATYNRLVLSAAQEWHKEEQFDLCHQVTIATWRVASPLWKLPIPFIWGPIGGAGNVPKVFRSSMSLQARVFEKLRDLSTFLSLRSPNFRECIREASIVFAANEETLNFLNPYRGDRPLRQLPNVSLNEKQISFLTNTTESLQGDHTLRLFAGGNIIGTKGVSIAIRALEKVRNAGIPFHYVVAGGGPEIKYLEKLVASLKLESCITFHSGYSGEEYRDILHMSDIYFLPSFRETTGMTLVDSILAGCYPIVADISAQGEIVRLVGGKTIPVTTVDGLIDGLAEAVIWCAGHREELYGTPALLRRNKVMEHFSSDKYESTLNKAYHDALNTDVIKKY